MKFLLSISFLLSASVALAKAPQVTVQGNCEIKVTPDRGTVTFTAENQSKDQSVAVNKTTAQINTLKEAIQKLNLKEVELKNTNYSVFPVREWEKEKMVEKGIRASLSLEVTTSDISRLGEAMMEASKAKITNVGTLNTFLSLEKSRDEYLKCLDVAAQDAKNKANQLAKKLGFKVGDVIDLNEIPNVQAPVPMGRAMLKTMSLDEAAPTQVEAGTQTFATQLQVTFSIK